MALAPWGRIEHWEVVFVFKSPVSCSPIGWAQVCVGAHLLLAESSPGWPMLPPSVVYAPLGRGISLHFLGGRPHPFAVAMATFCLLASWSGEECNGAASPGDCLCTSPFLGLSTSMAEWWDLVMDLVKYTLIGTLTTEVGKPETALQLQAVCAPHCSAEFRSLLKETNTSIHIYL